MTNIDEQQARVDRAFEEVARVLAERVETCSARMGIYEAFFAMLFAKLPHEVVNWGTAATDGEKYYFGAEFCASLDDDELMFICMHETLHVALMHPWRRGTKDAKLWNIAGDAVINFMIVSMNKRYKMPAGGVFFDWVNNDMDTEDVYNKLKAIGNDKSADGRPNGGASDGSGIPQGDDDADGEDGKEHPANTGGGGWDGTGDLMDSPHPEDANEVEAQIAVLAKMAKAAGKGDGTLDRIINTIGTPQLDWAELLRHYMVATSRDDYSYARGNKRFISSGLYLPSLHSDSIGGLVLAIDTSGSMGQRELDVIGAEVNAIFEDCRPDWVEVVYCDRTINEVVRFNQGDVVKLESRGGGGTRFKPVFDHVDEMQEPIACMVYFTDLKGNTNELQHPDYPVLWCLTSGREKPPFGDVVKVAI